MPSGPTARLGASARRASLTAAGASACKCTRAAPSLPPARDACDADNSASQAYQATSLCPSMSPDILPNQAMPPRLVLPPLPTLPAGLYSAPPAGAGGGGGARGAGGARCTPPCGRQVRRLLSPRPPRADNEQPMLLTCDDSLGYEYPFTLRLVDRGGMWCGRCPWSRLCRGWPHRQPPASLLIYIFSLTPAGTPLSEKRVSSTASVESDTDSGLPDKHSRQYSSDVSICVRCE
ncbi:unnamed protein product [Plutella xylostella]|uniref:(diamondback moth) hypothetical protein n=1 Tax=Plutella xylostella TaxID=51655 RepID=A0A8S4DNX2_PLUXY|nr:unnamed protein product [Plutella xylostella]